MKVVMKRLSDGGVCVHWLQRMENGPIQSGGSLQSNMGPLTMPKIGYQIACNPEQNTLSLDTGNEIQMCMRTEEPRAVSCPECKKTPAYVKAMAEIEGAK